MKKRWCSALFLALVSFAKAQPVAFDFDTDTPALVNGQNTPFDQTSVGVSARFNSPAAAAAFSIQTDVTTGWYMSQFSGHYIYANNQNGNVLEIKFSRQMTAITLTFATSDFQQVEVPTTIQVTAYLGSTTTPAVGSATAHGSYGQDTMPMGKLTFDSGRVPFDLVDITIAPGQPLGAGAFFVDNVVVTLAGLPSVISSVSAASYVTAASLAPGSIASGFGQALGSATDMASTRPLPTTLANATVSVKDSAGVEQQAPLFYASPTQINYLVPDTTALGPATVTVTSAGQVTATGTLNVERIAPGVFTANMEGKGAPAAEAITVAPDHTQTTQAVVTCGTASGSCVASPIDLGPSGSQVIVTLYGTGIRGRSSLPAVAATIAAMNAEVQYAGAQSEYVGLDQVNVVIPRALAGLGEVDLALTVEGKAANTVRLNIK